jgi:hypothetical protein
MAFGVNITLQLEFRERLCVRVCVRAALHVTICIISHEALPNYVASLPFAFPQFPYWLSTELMLILDSDIPNQCATKITWMPNVVELCWEGGGVVPLSNLDCYTGCLE